MSSFLRSGHGLCLVLIGFILLIFVPTKTAAEPLKPAQIRAAQMKLKTALKGGLSKFSNEVDAIAAGDADSAGQILVTFDLLELPDAEHLHVLTDALAKAIKGGASQTLIDAFKAPVKKNDEGWRNRVLIMQAFAATGGKQAHLLMIAAAQDAHPKVRLATAVALADAQLTDAEAVEVGTALLNSSENAKDLGTPHRLTRRALTRRTGHVQPDAKAWQQFWSDNGKDFTPDKRGDSEDLELPQPGDPRYYSDPITSRRLLFIIDTSKSMEGIDIDGWPDVPQEKRPIGGRASADGFGWVLSPEQWKWFEKNPEARRITRAKGELLRMLDKLPEDARFNIITFDTRLAAWNRNLVPASKANLLSARKFVQTLKADGHTRADLALAEIFRSNDEADTVYFLSDGTPTVDGKRVMPTEPLIRMVSRANLFHRIVINTYGIGTDGQPFLEELATETGGTYRKVIGPPEK